MEFLSHQSLQHRNAQTCHCLVCNANTSVIGQWGAHARNFMKNLGQVLIFDRKQKKESVSLKTPKLFSLVRMWGETQIAGCQDIVVNVAHLY